MHYHGFDAVFVHHDGAPDTRAGAASATRPGPERPARLREGILKEIGAYADATETTELPDDAQATEEALWTWYLEWSGIVRLCITDRRLLRAMGFLKPTRTPKSGDEDAELVEGEVGEVDATPAPAAPAIVTVVSGGVA